MAHPPCALQQDGDVVQQNDVDHVLCASVRGGPIIHASQPGADQDLPDPVRLDVQRPGERR